ncbi:MAG: AAA family ATPase [Deltaproteobacteria bacterium]
MSKGRDKLRELELLIRSHYSLIFIDTAEEDRARTVLTLLAGRMKIPYFYWTRTKGLKRVDIESKGPVYGSTDIGQALSHIESSKFQALYHFKEPGDILEDRDLTEMLKDAAAPYSKNYGAIILTGNDIRVPDTLKPQSAYFKMPEPDREEYRELLGRVVRDIYSRMTVDVKLSDEDTERLLNGIKGLTLTEAEKIITKVVVEDGALSSEDIRRVIDAKSDIVEKEGVLEYYPAEESMDEIADLKTLKTWLSKRKEIILHPDKAAEFGLSFPKGILLLGVPGCGKSLSARAVAMEWGLPLMKLDPSNLYNKYIGESEKNFKRAMKTAEKMSPVVLWIDEIEKAFSTGGESEDGGVSRRVFGTFLSWLQDRKGDVFVVATANDVRKLPPELLRKGRFDEIFFVDLPDSEARQSIFRIHLAKRGKNPDDFDLTLLARKTGGFSGSEIGQAIVSGLYTAFSGKKELSTEILLDEVALTCPLSQTMSEQIVRLRQWASERTVSAH